MAYLLPLRLPNPKPNFPIRASSSTSTTSPSTTTPTTTTTTTVTTQSPPQSLEERFGRKGIKFSESGDVPAVELSVRNGSSLRLRIPDGLITSYKPKVQWKEDGFKEVVHTIPASSDPASLKGGIGLILNDVSKLDTNGSLWSASDWAVKDADSDSFDAVQVELSCTNGDGSLDITYVVSLYPLSMANAVIVKNVGAEAVKLTSGILSHIKFDSRRGSAIQGLRGCSYCAHPPLSSSFGILSPAEAMQPDPPGWFSFLGSDNKDNKKDSWTVEDDLYTILRGKTSRVYAAPPSERLKRIFSTPPSKYTTIDQGSGLGFRVIRMGYDDIYLGSPGSSFEKFGKEYFICTGPASMLVPLVLNPGDEWRGAQVIEHDNL
ncbi:photosynthetic NDH subunit of subcomplex B 2, chloroplastic [Typha latifolia]|uniref:photosynthetic NDH subunit of subcomplex B 2, chloroplastic n=1 Tax=Typha latifolia TaxID=4733 RepID=UPI003C2AE695